MGSIRFASFAIGIDEYPDGFYRQQEAPLKCASADASRIRAWSSSAFPSDTSVHYCLLNAEATYAAIETSFEKIASIDGLDYFLLYLAGHGRRIGQGAAFCAYDHAVEGPKIDVRSLDSMLRRVPAKNVLAIIDCCHAEAVLWESQFFDRLEGTRSRLFVASCQADQLCYEDDLLKSATDSNGSSLLALALFEALDEAARSGAKQVGLDDVLFPYLKKRVPNLAFRLKRRAQQEPVTGGLSRDNVFLPIASHHRPPPPTFAALAARWRSLLVGISSAAAVSLVIIYAATWHLEFSSNGNLALFAGPSWLPSLPGDLLLRSELPLTVSDISGEPSVRSTALSRKIEGVWWQFDRFEQRRWLQTLNNALQTGMSTYLKALNGMPLEMKLKSYNMIDPETFGFNDDPTPGYRSFIFGPSPPDISDATAVSAASVLGRTFDIGELIRPIVHHKNIDNFNSNVCSSPVRYDYLDWDNGDFWQALSPLAANSDDPELFDFLIFEAKIFDVILRAEPPRPQFPESGALDYMVFSADKFRRLVRSYAMGQVSRHGSPLNDGDLGKLARLGQSECGLMADLILSWLGRERNDPELPARLLNGLETHPSRYGRRGETVVKLILGAFEEMCIRQARRNRSKGWDLFSRIPQSINPEDRYRIAMRLTANGGLPEEVEEVLFRTVELWPKRLPASTIPIALSSPFSKSFSNPSEALVTLSAAVSKMSPGSRQRYVGLNDAIERIAKSDGLGAIADSLDSYARGLSEIGPLPPPVSNYLFGAEKGGEGGKRRFLLAQRLVMIARMVSQGYRDPRLTEAVFDAAGPIDGLNFADWRGALQVRFDAEWILAARAQIRYRDKPPRPAELLATIRQLRGKARERRVEVLMVQEYLRNSQLAEKQKWIADLTALATREPEPELRADLASLAVRLFASIELEDFDHSPQ